LGGETGGEETAEPESAVEKITERVIVPRFVNDWKQNAEERKLAESLQTRIRLAFESAFARGLVITGYERSPEGDGFFLLRPAGGLEQT
jgi:hypothetical protein